MLRKIVSAAFAASMLVGCQTAKPIPAVPETLTPEQIAAVQAGVKSTLKDPLSALFDRQFVAAIGQDGMFVVCGYVNAKNSFGGYTGAKPFAGSLVGNLFTVIGMGGTDIETMVTLNYCGQYGIYI